MRQEPLNYGASPAGSILGAGKLPETSPKSPISKSLFHFWGTIRFPCEVKTHLKRKTSSQVDLFPAEMVGPDLRDATDSFKTLRIPAWSENVKVVALFLIVPIHFPIIS